MLNGVAVDRYRASSVCSRLIEGTLLFVMQRLLPVRQRTCPTSLSREEVACRPCCTLPRMVIVPRLDWRLARRMRESKWHSVPLEIVS